MVVASSWAATKSASIKPFCSALIFASGIPPLSVIPNICLCIMSSISIAVKAFFPFCFSFSIMRIIRLLVSKSQKIYPCMFFNVYEGEFSIAPIIEFCIGNVYLFISAFNSQSGLVNTSSNKNCNASFWRSFSTKA